jgi:predicted ATP-binding protein involved in virulence
MYLSKLEIVNFKSFAEVSFDFHPKVNVLTGVNNAGKTTVLEALALWHECYRKLVRRAGRATKQYQKDDYILGTSAPTYVSYHEITSVRSPNYEDVFYNLDADFKRPILITATFASDKNELLSIPLRLARADGDTYNVSCDNYNGFNFKLFNNRDFLKDPEKGIHLAYESPISTLLPIENKQLPAQIRFFKQSRLSVQVFRNRLAQLHEIRSGDIDRFAANLKFVLTNNTEEIQFKFSTDANDIREIVKISIGREPFKDISLLGSGTIQMMSILLSFFEDRRDLNLVLLDEPDSHIHHVLQKKLLDVFEKFGQNSQVFVTTHNEALIRAAKSEWVFHLEKRAHAQYQPIINQSFTGIKKGFQPSYLSPIILNLTGATTLDFVHALEADKLILVEGQDDAVRIQKILSLRFNDPQRYAFWAADGVGAYFSQIAALKNIFSTIKNRQSLWEKAVLIMDKDDMTDAQRTAIIDGFTKTLGIKTHIWQSYNFESILLSNFNKFADLLLKYIRAKNNSTTTTLSQILNHLQIAVEKALSEIEKIYKDESEIDRIFGRLKSRRDMFQNPHLGIKLPKVFEEEKDLKLKLTRYYESCLNLRDFHKICRKPQMAQIITDVLATEGLTFHIEQDFDEFFNYIDTSIVWDDFNFVLSI